MVGNPSHGTLSGTAPNLTYTPAADYHGADSFTLWSTTASVDSAPATVCLTVTPVNDAPVAMPQAVTTAEDTAVAITLAGTDAEGDALTFSVVGDRQPRHAERHGAEPDLHAGRRLPRSPTASPSGQRRQVDSAPATVSITVTPVNDAPVAHAQAVTTAEDTAVAITLTGTDADGDSLTFSRRRQPPATAR